MPFSAFLQEYSRMTITHLFLQLFIRIFYFHDSTLFFLDSLPSRHKNTTNASVNMSPCNDFFPMHFCLLFLSLFFFSTTSKWLQIHLQILQSFFVSFLSFFRLCHFIFPSKVTFCPRRGGQSWKENKTLLGVVWRDAGWQIRSGAAITGRVPRERSRLGARPRRRMTSIVGSCCCCRKRSREEEQRTARRRRRRRRATSSGPSSVSGGLWALTMGTNPW